jgi:hypothetical protein
MSPVKSKFFLFFDKKGIPMRGLFLSVFMCILAFFPRIDGSDFLEKLFLVQMKNDSDWGESQTGLYDYYTCDSCGRAYQSQPSECGTCGETSFTRHDQLDD